MKDVIGFEGYYKVTPTGKVWSVRNDKYLSPGVCSGYEQVNLSVNGNRIKKSIHRLVSEAYICNTNNKPCVNHKDGNKLNNNIENLEWVTNSENTKHSYATGLQIGKSIKGGTNVLSKAIIMMDAKTSKCLYEFDCIATAAEYFNIATTSIRRVLYGTRGSWRGMYIFYKNY